MNNYAGAIKSLVSMQDLAMRYGLTVNRAGYTLCPFHGERSASLRVYPGDGGWHCFGCHKGGDVIDFVREYYGLTYPQALVRLNADFSLGLPLGRALTLGERRAIEERQKQRQQDRREWVETWQEAFRNWQTAFDRWLLLDHLRRDTAPKAMDEPFQAAYAYALYKLPEARYEAKRTEDALREIEGQRRVDRERSA